jgi:hypothetical protein
VEPQPKPNKNPRTTPSEIKLVGAIDSIAQAVQVNRPCQKILGTTAENKKPQYENKE